jgi:hypothetical protein
MSAIRLNASIPERKERTVTKIIKAMQPPRKLQRYTSPLSSPVCMVSSISGRSRQVIENTQRIEYRSGKQVAVILIAWTQHAGSTEAAGTKWNFCVPPRAGRWSLHRRRLLPDSQSRNAGYHLTSSWPPHRDAWQRRRPTNSQAVDPDVNSVKDTQSSCWNHFLENYPDLRNSKVADLVANYRFCCNVSVHDP